MFESPLAAWFVFKLADAGLFSIVRKPAVIFPGYVLSFD